MFNIIICDDNKQILERVEKIVNKCFINSGYEYQTHLYNDYNSNFMQIINRKLSFKIYILDIETPSRSGIDVAREIRRKDIDSVIIFLTGHEELGNIVLKNDLLFLSFINKFDNFEERLTNCIRKSFDILHQKQVVRIKDNNNVYIINLDDILYISKDSYERKSIIVTDYTEYKVNKALSEIYNLLDYRFIRTHRACIVNKTRISKIDKTNKVISFDNGITTDLLSDKYKKVLGV